MTEKIDPDRRECIVCAGGGWVCENHPAMSWPDECRCGAGMPCDCNNSEPPWRHGQPTNPGGQWDVPEPKSDEPQVFSQGMSSAQYEMHEAMNKLVRMIFEQGRRLDELERNDKA